MDIPQLTAEQYVIRWPEPAHAKFNEDPIKVEPCEIELKNGTKEIGDLLHFTARDGFFIFRPHKDHAQRAQMIAVKLANLRQLRLTRGITMTPLSNESLGQASDSVAASAMQVYNVEFADGEITSGETAGYVKLPVGLFLYFQADSGEVMRHFVPTDAIAYSQLGDPIGKVLVEENLVSEAQLKVAVEKQQEMRRLVLGDYLIEEGYITADQLNKALEYQKAKPSLRVGEALIEMGFVTSDALQAALDKQRANRGRPLAQILLDMGVVDRDTLERVNAKKASMPEVSLSGFSISPDALKLIPADVARRLHVMPLAVEDGALIIAVAVQPGSSSMSELGLLARMRVVPVLAPDAEIVAKQKEAYGAATIERIVDPKSIGFEGGAQLSPTDAVSALVERQTPFSALEKTDLKSERVLHALIERISSGAFPAGVLDIKIETDGVKRRTQISFRKT